MKKITLKISGMKCRGCLNNVKETLLNIKGVKKVNVSLENGLAFIDVEENVNSKILEDTINTITQYKATFEKEEY